MHLYQIRYFLAVCEALNFTKAAERCNVTQPSLTRAIQNLEYELGGQLFIRGRAGATLTPFGEAMRLELEQIQAHVNTARAAAEGWTSGTTGILRIGVCTAAGPFRVARFLGAFQAQYEGMTLVLSEGSFEELCTRLKRLDIDAALVASCDVLDANIAHLCLYEERLVVVMPAKHDLSRLDAVPVGRLAGERVMLNTRRDLRSPMLLAFKAAEVEARITCHSERDEWLIGMVAEGAGIAVVPEGLSIPPPLTARPLCKPLQKQSVHLLPGENPSAETMVRKLSDFAAQYPARNPMPPCQDATSLRQCSAGSSPAASPSQVQHEAGIDCANDSP